MSDTVHQRAMELITMRSIEGIDDPDSMWLQSHLSECAECGKFAESLDFARQAMWTVPIEAGAELVAATKARVHIRALELRERAAKSVLIGLSVAVGSVLSSISLYYAWPLVTWLETHFELPAIVVEPGMIVAWFLPTTIAIAGFIAARTHVRRQEGQQVAAMHSTGYSEEGR